MFQLLNWRIWLLAGLLALMPILYGKGRIDGGKLANAKHLQAQIAANSEIRALENLRQSRADQAVALAATRARGLAADAARIRSVADGLRGTLDAVERSAKESHDAATKSVTALRAVFDSCRAEYEAVGLAAQGHANDSRAYQDAWPR